MHEKMAPEIFWGMHSQFTKAHPQNSGAQHRPQNFM